MRSLPIACAMFACVACLPDDTRPPPAALTVLVTSNAVEPIQTSDGWQIVFERLLVSVGEVHLKESDACFVYNETDYLRVLDGLRTEPQLLSRPYALGGCDLAFRLQQPSLDSALGSGIATDDLILLGTPGSDSYVDDSGLSLFVAGTATNGSRAKHFEWSFRNGVQYECTGTDANLLSLSEDGSETFEIALVAASLFQNTPDDATAQLVFEEIALADDAQGDADGTIDFAELANTPLTVPEATFASLADRIYLGRVPLLPRIVGGECSRGPIEDDEGGP